MLYHIMEEEKLAWFIYAYVSLAMYSSFNIPERQKTMYNSFGTCISVTLYCITSTSVNMFTSKTTRPLWAKKGFYDSSSNYLGK